MITVVRHVALLCVAVALLCSAAGATQPAPPAASPTPVPAWGDPVPDPAAVVLAPDGVAQFTVLTPAIIRMQYAPTGAAAFRTQNVQTYAILNRKMPVPKFTSSVSGDGVLTISTSVLQLTYTGGAWASSFNGENLQVKVLNADGLGNSSVWTAAPSVSQEGNLLGTLRTLDGSDGTNRPLNCDINMDGDSHCTWGLIGTNGYAVVDDTGAPAFDAPGPVWPWLRSQPNEPVDEALCGLEDAERRQCGFNGIASDECARRGCCWDNSTLDGQDPSLSQADPPLVPVCFYSSNASQDLYFLGHGREFKQALLEFTQLAGPVPAPPRYMFGVFFSRYWAYSDWEEYELVQEYIDHQCPLDTLVTDMDWHYTFYSESDAGVKDQAGQTIGWTGFTFDPKLFPNHTAFFEWCHNMGLKNTLNVHPASGIQPWEEKYPDMAVAMGQNPADGRYVPYNATDPDFNTNWMQLVMAPLEQAGVTFWWLDWQQGEEWIKESRLNPTMVLNWLFYTNPYHWGVNGRRPGLLHRWGGLGNHRYQLGFSGDVIPSWDALAFQPYFTATASNVGYGYWSHDIGGHLAMPSPELYTRWIQFGALSPMFRTHCTKDGNNDRRIWVFPFPYYQIMRVYLRLRSTLVPYLADHALTTYETGLSLLLPLYYNWPLYDEAYPDSGVSKTSYTFGASLFVSPIVAPLDNDTQLAFKTIWLPPGQWVGFFSNDILQGPMQLEINVTLAEMPLWARVGAIVPLRPLPTTADPGSALIGAAHTLPSTLQLLTFVAGQSSGGLTLREDEGDTLAYQTGEWATTQASFEVSGDNNATLLYTIVQQQVFAGFMTTRSYRIDLRGVYAAQSVTIVGSDEEIPFQPFYMTEAQAAAIGNTWSYDAATLTLQIHLRTPVPSTAGSKLQLLVQLTDSTLCPYLVRFDGFPGRLARVQSLKKQLDNLWRTPSMVYDDRYPNFLFAAETASRINSRPETARDELAAFDVRMQAACGEMANIKCFQECNPTLVQQVTAWLNCPQEQARKE